MREITITMEDDVAVATFSRGAEKTNALSERSLDEFRSLFEYLRDCDATGLVIRSGHPESFIVGADLSVFDRLNTQADARAMWKRGRATMDLLVNANKPVVCAIHGPALGGGLELALACTARVASDDPKTRLGFPEVFLGLLPGVGGLQRLATLTGSARALELALTGASLRARDALHAGIVDRVVSESSLTDTAITMVRELASNPRARRRATSLLRRARDRAALMSSSALLRARVPARFEAPFRTLDVLLAHEMRGPLASVRMEGDAFASLVVAPPCRELRALFFAHRARKPDASRADGACRVGIVGMTPEALVVAKGVLRNGHALVLADDRVNQAERAKKTLERSLRRAAERGRIDSSELHAARSRVELATGTTRAHLDLIVRFRDGTAIATEGDPALIDATGRDGRTADTSTTLARILAAPDGGVLVETRAPARAHMRWLAMQVEAPLIERDDGSSWLVDRIGVALRTALRDAFELPNARLALALRAAGWSSRVHAWLEVDASRSPRSVYPTRMAPLFAASTRWLAERAPRVGRDDNIAAFAHRVLDTACRQALRDDSGLTSDDLRLVAVLGLGFPPFETLSAFHNTPLFGVRAGALG